MQHEATRTRSMLYPLTLDVRYKVVSGKQQLAGTGRTTFVGSGTLVFHAEHDLKKGVQLEVAVFWPVLLEGHVRLQLVVQGRAAAVDGQRITVTISRHNFLTRRSTLPAAKAPFWLPGAPPANGAPDPGPNARGRLNR